MFDYDWEGLIVGGILCVIVVLVILIGAATAQERKEWDQFKVAHNCKIVGQKQGHYETGTGYTTSGKGGMVVTTTRTPDETGFLCDDGITYWRNK